MKCFFCERTISQGFTLRRINPKGQKGIWACAEHFAQTDAPRIAEVEEIITILEEAR